MNNLNLGISLNYENIIEALKETKKLKANVLQIYNGDKRLTTLSKKIKLNNKEIKEIKTFLKENKIKLFIHAILSLNFCNNPHIPRNKWGIDNLIYDLDTCKKINGSGVIIHMGTHKTKKINISYDDCVINFIESLKIVLDNTKKIPILLETPVNRPNIIGGTIEKLANIYNKIPEKYIKRIKICVDTQHIFSSGINLRNLDITKEYFDKIIKLINIKNLELIHLNDSAVEFNSKIDRHESIAKGYIFKNHLKELNFLINFAKANNIPLVLETKLETYSDNINIIKKLNNNIDNKKDIKPLILNIFEEILNYHQSLGEKKNKSTKYRIDSYIKVINSIKNFDKPIYDCNDVKDLEGVGKGFCEKINIISKTGTLNIYENILKNNKINSIKLFQKIWGIGPIQAEKIVQKNIFTIEQLKLAIIKGNYTLNDQQLIALKYFEDLQKKIPRKEIEYYTNYIKSKIKNKIYNAGSYRYGKELSGDIDLILTYNNLNENNKIIKKKFFEIFNKKLIKDILSDGLEKSMFIVKLKKYDFYRKLDIAFVDEKNLPWYLLYFGSSKDFSKKIRYIASKKGYKLNEKGLFDKKTNLKIDFNPKDEKEIFDFLEIDYVLPEKRI